MNVSINDIHSIQYVLFQIVGLLENFFTERDISVPGTLGMTKANKALLKEMKRKLAKATRVKVTDGCKANIPTIEETNKKFFELVNAVSKLGSSLSKSEKAYIREVYQLFVEASILLLECKD